MPENVIPIGPPRRRDFRPADAQRVIRARSVKTENIKFTTHALQRSQERAITTVDALHILRAGTVTDQPVRNDRGDWEVKVEKRLSTGREACAVTIVITDDDTLIVKTLMWVDGR